ncbi:MAG: hypothetical protein ACE14L_08880 [Terriglobales bacterium]
MVAVLQGWSKSTMPQRLTGIVFLAVFALAAGWGVRLLFLRS